MTSTPQQAIKQSEAKHDPYVYHDIHLISSTKLEINIMVFGENLSVGRTLTETDKDKMTNTINMFRYLDEQVMLETARDPEYGWNSLKDWRTWATAKLTAFTDKLVEEQAERIDSKRKEIAKKRLANKQMINPIYVLSEKGAKMEIASQLADKMGFTEQVAE